MEKPDFSKIFASNSALSAYTFSDADYLTGWNFIGSTPPARTMFDAWMRQSDTKMKWLHDNALYDSSLEDILFWRMPLTTYAVGARRCLRNGPLGVYLLCIIAGTTDDNVLSSLPTGTEVGNIFTDGSVTWEVMQHVSTADLSEHASANDAHALLFAEKQPLDATLTSLAGLTTAADQVPYSTGVDSFSMTTMTKFARTLIGAESASDVRDDIGAAPLVSPILTGTPTAPTPAPEICTNQIATTKYAQPRDVKLTALASVAVDADKIIYATGQDKFTATALTEFARSLIDDPDAASARVTLGALGNDHDADAAAHAAAFAAHTNEFGVATLKRDRAYVVGDIAYSNHLPTWARLECVTAGKTALTEPELSTVTTAGAYILDGKVKWILADIRDAAPVGELQLFYSLHPGYVKANGATVNRADYPRLVTFAETNKLWVDYTLKFSGTTTANSATVTGISSADMAKLQREMKVTGTGIPAGTTISKLDRTALTITLSAVATAAGKIDISYGFDENFPERFGAGDGSTTFTLPNAIGRVLEAGTAADSSAAGLPNIIGYVPTVYMDSNTVGTGAISVAPKVYYSVIAGDNSAFYSFSLDASKSSALYGNSDGVQPLAIRLIPQLRY